MRMFFHDPGGLPYMTAISAMIAKELTCRAPSLRALRGRGFWFEYVPAGSVARCVLELSVMVVCMWILSVWRMVNWTALLGLEQGVKVMHTSRSWIVHVETLYRKHPGEWSVLAKNLADRVAKSLMMKYGCRLTEGEVCQGCELKVDDPVANLLARYFCVSTPERKIGHSPGVSEG